jgi:hypothetical protein
MSNTEAILEFLEAIQKKCCDDCLSRGAHVEPRQQVNRICRRLAQQGTIVRENEMCALCARRKAVNIIRGLAQRRPVDASPAPGPRVFAAPSQRQEQMPSIEAFRNHLDRFCKKLLENRPNSRRNGLAALISELSDRGVVPLHQANMMHTIRALRNAYVHEHIDMGDRERTIAKAAWAIITEWAEKHQPEPWRLTSGWS